MIDRDTFADLVSALCSPVTVVTTMTGEGPYGSTVSSFTSLSNDPPLMTFALSRTSGLLKYLRPGARVGANVLGADQRDLASAFAHRNRGPCAKFAGIDWRPRGGLPYLPESAGWTAGHVERHVDGGDHVLLVVRVEEAESTTTAPLIYARRVFGTHSAHALAG
ncbi:flavin reductase family protein [Amycolatopsis samaneae]|uniref:Flavin reductase family protein n=1 Tax=Amycolatopsis samaneae TaxID=664691 RepID=A0ABW5GEX7_9PSEU